MTDVRRREAAKHAPGHPHAPRIPFALLVTALVVGGLCTLLALNTASAANELSRHDLAVSDANIAAQVQVLRNDVAASAAPAAVANAAGALGMVPAGNPAFLSIAPNGTVYLRGVPGPAAAPPSPPRPSPTPTKKSTTSSKATATSHATSAKSTAASHATSAKSSTAPHPTPHPTDTPIPTTTLGGGPR
jgi:hypothetical protein